MGVARRERSSSLEEETDHTDRPLFFPDAPRKQASNKGRQGTHRTILAALLFGVCALFRLVLVNIVSTTVKALMVVVDRRARREMKRDRVQMGIQCAPLFDSAVGSLGVNIRVSQGLQYLDHLITHEVLLQRSQLMYTSHSPHAGLPRSSFALPSNHAIPCISQMTAHISDTPDLEINRQFGRYQAVLSTPTASETVSWVAAYVSLTTIASATRAVFHPSMMINRWPASPPSQYSSLGLTTAPRRDSQRLEHLHAFG